MNDKTEASVSFSALSIWQLFGRMIFCGKTIKFPRLDYSEYDMSTKLEIQSQRVQSAIIIINDSLPIYLYR